MKKHWILVLGLGASINSYSMGSQLPEETQDSQVTDDHKTEHEHILNPEQEEEFRTQIQNMATGSGFRFAQTSWAECTEDPSGNFAGYRCASSRQISVILEKFLQENIYQCLDEGLAAQGGGQAADLHIVHDGILGDRNHSPRSLHAEARAIDIKSLEITLKTGVKRNVVYAGTANRKFYTAFRKCWGRVINSKNKCPFYNGSSQLTGSIGWEDANHKQHMHTSVPYCVNGSYGSGFFQR